MGWMVLLVLVVGVPAALLLWTRRNRNPDEGGFDRPTPHLDAQRSPYRNPAGPDYGATGQL
jgi:hypothetical protein